MIILDANYSINPQWIFISFNSIVLGASTVISLINGNYNENILWSVGSDLTIGASTNFIGTILSKDTGACTIGANTIIIGRMLAHTVTVGNGCVLSLI